MNTLPEKSPLIIAHRGASAVAPENTLAGFARAIESGADGVELDVQLARDGVPVVIHDSTLRRTGRCKGIVAEMTSRELGEIDVGSWFNRVHPRQARVEYARESVPTLDQVLSYFKKHRQARRAVIYVEIKNERVRDDALELAESVIELIKRHHLKTRVVVISFDLGTLAAVKKLEPVICTGALFEPTRSAVKIRAARRMIAAAIDSGANEILLHRLIATRRVLRLASENNLRSVVWTVNDAKWLRRAQGSGVHALVTNNPLEMIRASPE